MNTEKSAPAKKQPFQFNIPFCSKFLLFQKHGGDFLIIYVYARRSSVVSKHNVVSELGKLLFFNETFFIFPSSMRQRNILMVISPSRHECFFLCLKDIFDVLVVKSLISVYRFSCLECDNPSQISFERIRKVIRIFCIL